MAVILVMEDDDVIRALISHICEMDGHTVLSYDDAAPALDEGELDTVDLVLTDLTMPTTGESAIRVLRSRGYRMPILVLTGHVEEGKADYLVSLGADRVVHKPFTAGSLLELIREFLPP